MEYIGQFKKACLTRKANLKTAKERLEKDKASGHETDFRSLQESAGKLNALYNKLTEIEASPSGRSKTAYTGICEQIRTECIKFNGYLAQVKTFYTKAAPKKKAKEAET